MTVPVDVVSNRQRVREAAPGVVRAHRSCARAHVAHGAQRARRVTKCTRGSRRVFASPLFCRPTAKPRRTSSPSICQRNNTAIHFALASRPLRFISLWPRGFNGLKSKVGLTAAKAEVLRMNLDINGCCAVAPHVHSSRSPPHAPLLLANLLAHNPPVPRVHSSARTLSLSRSISLSFSICLPLSHTGAQFLHFREENTSKSGKSLMKDPVSAEGLRLLINNNSLAAISVGRIMI